MFANLSILQGFPGARGTPGPKGRKGELIFATRKGALIFRYMVH